MECKKCGKPVKKTDAFCQYCGTKLEAEKKETKTTKKVEKKEEVKQEVVKTEVVEQKKSGNGLAIAGMVLGIIGIVFSLIVGPFAFLFPLLGLIFALCAKGKSGYKTAGIITSIVGFVIGIIYLILGVFVFSSLLGLAGNYINNYSYASPYGEWTCTSYPSYSYKNSEETTLNLKYDGTYIYGPKDELENNHYSGTFTYTSETDKNEKYSGKKFFDIKAPVTEYINQGVKGSTYGKNLNMEMQLINDYDEAIIMFYNTYNTYKCTK